MSRFVTLQIEKTPVYLEKSHYLNVPLVTLKHALEPIEPYIQNIQEHGKTAIARCHYPSEHDLTREESAAIFLYSMETEPDSFYRLLNRVLRSGNTIALQPWCFYVKLLNEALNKLPPVQQSVWRGGSANQSGEFREGQKMCWSSFTSCSSSLPVTKQFLGSKGTLFMIEVTSAKDISKYACMPEEKEILLGPGIELTVVSDSLEYKDNLQVVHLKETTKVRLVILIGVSGPTGCSRHDYANHLAQSLNSPFEPLLMKSFWRRTISIQHPQLGKVKSGELPESHDLEEFAMTLRNIRSNPTQSSRYLKRREGVKIEKPMIIVVDGLLLFGCTDEITSMFDVRIFIEGNLEKCRLARYRRDQRIHNHVKNDNITIPMEWQQHYDNIIWYEYLKRRDEQKRHAGKVFQDSSNSERDFEVRNAYIDQVLKEMRR